jgi:ABC-type nickel/cobalt efflux system permease component RcnA
MYNDTTRFLGDELKYQQLAEWDANGNGFYQDYDGQFLMRLEAPGESMAVTNATALTFDWTFTAKAAMASGENEILAGFTEPVALNEQSGTHVGPAPATDAEAPPAVAGRQARWARQLSDIVRSGELPFPMVLAGLMIAVAMGAGHALSPGHGKTVMAAYLIGERGTYLHAVVLGLVVTITHTWSIVLFGSGILYAGEHIVPESVEFWSGLLSGAIILLLGAFLFIQRYRTFVLATGAGGHHPGAMDHGHSHGPPPESPGPASYRNILWLGISGGIVPCPAALIVLLLAIKADRLGYGLGLILAFSAGLAAVLVVIGIAIVRAGGAVRKRFGERQTLLLALPVFSSILITLLGAWVVVWTLIQFNVLIVMPTT